jgi:hypothetical protein
MRLPYLKSWDNTPVVISITEGIGENGEPNVVATYTGNCCYNEKSKTVRTADGQLIQLNAVLTVGCDIASDVPVLAGEVEVAGKTWKIHSGSRGRNPDGTVHHTKLELMKVSVKMKPQAVKALSKAQAQAAAQTAQQMVNEVRNDGVMPFDTGNMQNESTFIEDKNATKGIVSIIHDTPYARRLYFHPEYDFNTSKNTSARGEWWEEWLTGAKKKRPMNLFKQFYKRIAGRYL